MKSLSHLALLALFIGFLGSPAHAESPVLSCELLPGTQAAYGREYSYIVITNISDRPLRLATGESPNQHTQSLIQPPPKHADTYASAYTFGYQAQPPVFHGEARDSSGQAFSIGLPKTRTAFENLSWKPGSTFTLWPHARVTCYTTAITPRPSTASLHFLEYVQGAFQSVQAELTAPK